MVWRRELFFVISRSRVSQGNWDRERSRQCLEKLDLGLNRVRISRQPVHPLCCSERDRLSGWYSSACAQGRCAGRARTIAEGDFETSFRRLAVNQSYDTAHEEPPSF